MVAACDKTDNRILAAEQEVNNTQNDSAPSIPKKEAVLSHNEEPEEFAVIEMDTPTVFIKKGNSIDVFIELARNESLSPNIAETDSYIIFAIQEKDANIREQTSLIYRKKDGKFFRFNANGGHENMLYHINYETRTFDFFEIADNGIKKDITSVPIPNKSDNWYVGRNGFLTSTIYIYYNHGWGKKEVYILDGTTLTKHAEFPSNVSIIGSFPPFAHYSRYSNNNVMKLINLSNMKEINIENGDLIDIEEESIFLTDGNRMIHYDIATDSYSFMEYIINAENTRNNGYYLKDCHIRGYEDYPLNMIYRVHNNQFLFGTANNKICIYDFETGILYILFDYNIYPDTRGMGPLYLINDSYFFAGTFGRADLVSLDDKKIICRFIMKWFDPEIIDDVSYMWYYETREGDIIICPRYHKTRD